MLPILKEESLPGISWVVVSMFLSMLLQEQIDLGEREGRMLDVCVCVCVCVCPQGRDKWMPLHMSVYHEDWSTLNREIGQQTRIRWIRKIFEICPYFELEFITTDTFFQNTNCYNIIFNFSVHVNIKKCSRGAFQ